MCGHTSSGSGGGGGSDGSDPWIDPARGIAVMASDLEAADTMEHSCDNLRVLILRVTCY